MISPAIGLLLALLLAWLFFTGRLTAIAQLIVKPAATPAPAP